MIDSLANIRVVDLSNRFSGAFASRLFGDFGAEVLLVEPPEGHPLRYEPPFLNGCVGDEQSFVHAFANWNKKSVIVDEQDDRNALIRSADVVVTTTCNRKTIEQTRELAPSHSVLLSITPHGIDDPLTDIPGNNLTISARSGWASINGYGSEPPLAMPRNQSDIVGGIAGFIAAVAAMRRRNSTDHAELVDVSELEAFALTVHPWGVAAAYSNVPPRIGANRARTRGSPGPLWNLADGKMNFGLADFKNWTAAMEAVNRPDLGAKQNLIPDIGRHSQDLREVVHGLAETLPQLNRWDVFHSLTQLRCVVGVVQDMKDIVNNEQFDQRNFFVDTMVHEKPVKTSGAPAMLSPSPWRLRHTAPKLGSARQDQLDPKCKLSAELSRLSEAELQEGPLVGVRVLSFGQAWSGTFATELLALLGADVVQVASHYHPDAFRRIRNVVPPGVADPTRMQHPRNTQGHYNSVNLHKREITLDVRNKKGKKVLWQLIPKFDIVVDNFRPGVLPSWGINLEELHRVRPGMIWASISGYGESGPYRDYPANGATTEPMSGFSSIHGYNGDTGMNTGGLYPDPISGYFLVAFILAAQNHRDRTGLPQRVDLSMMEAVAAVLGDYVMEYSASNEVPIPTGNDHLRHAPYGIYPTKDEWWVAIAVESDQMWRKLVETVGDPALRRGEFVIESSRLRQRAHIDEKIEAWTKSETALQIEKALCESGVCAARVVPLTELYRKPSAHFVESGFLNRIYHPEAGATWLPGRPWRFSEAVQVPIRPAPCVGEHSWEVFRDELGIDKETYEAWVAEGITGTLYEIQNTAQPGS